MSVRFSFFTSPCKGEVGCEAAGWGSFGLCRNLTPSLTLPLSGGGKSKQEVGR